MFSNAKPVWLKDKEDEMNVAAAFTETVGSIEGAEILIAACSFYRIYVNGKFVAFGPARTAGGYARVDVLSLSEYDKGEKNTVRIEVVAYNCRSLSTCIGKGFLTAEIRRDGEVIAYTGRDFSAFLMRQKEQRVERFSLQRHFAEVWDCTKDDEPMEWALTEDTPSYLERHAPYPLYRDALTTRAVTVGDFSASDAPPKRPSHNKFSFHWGCFDEADIKNNPYRFVLSQNQSPRAHNVSLPLTLKAGEYAVFDLSKIECGFVRFSASVSEKTDVVIGYSEYFEGEKFDFTNIGCYNAVESILPDGFNGEWQSFEPYTMRFGIVMVKSGSIALSSFGIKTYERDMSGIKLKSFENQTYRKIYDAAVRTFAHNAVDLYMDCPSRERAGWLCDSYFTATVEDYFFGEVPVENDYLENFRIGTPPHLAGGLVPMCYPSDIMMRERTDGNHIPQWCMWYILEVKEYLTMRNTSVDKEIFRESVEGIINYLVLFENADGLLEDIPGWNFVEWSAANKWVTNVNYPSNFLYAATLKAAGELYGRQSYIKRAERVRKKAAALSFDGELFTDNAVKDENGVLKNTGNTSEACQYYAYLFGDIDLSDERYKKYKKHLLSGCKSTDRTVEPMNAFIGLYLRIKMLLQMKEYKLLLDELDGFFGDMADKTGTLWENRWFTSGSLDHGFASYAAYAMCVAIENL